jgi:pyrimidine operon attenuation protein/uracil phosphoribosyltransferase
MNIVCDLGRPAAVRLAVVVDRGGRELPIQADYVGMWLQASPGERIVVRVRPIDQTEGIEYLSSPD